MPNSRVRPWDDFLYEFKEKYTPEVYRDQKQREFLNIAQRNLSVADYEEKFTQLSHYADFLVATERDKCRHFEEGLRYDIRPRSHLLIWRASRGYGLWPFG